MKHCLICFKDVYHKTSFLAYLQKPDCICGQCQMQFVPCLKTLTLNDIPLEALYMYSPFLESLLFQFKEGRDIALKEVFIRKKQLAIFDKYKGYTLVYMPSSSGKTTERGFFPLAQCFAQVPLPKVHLFVKNKNVKQSLQSFTNRQKIKNCIALKKGVAIPNSKLLLIDDVCTSGNTLNCAYQLLSFHTYEIRALVISVHPRYVESCD